MSTFAQASNDPRMQEDVAPEFQDAPTSFMDIFPPPITIGGKEVAPLNTRDYAPWIQSETDRIKQQRRATLTGDILQRASAEERFRITANIDEFEMIPDAFIDYIWKVDWQEKIILKALEKAGIDRTAGEAFLKTLAAKQQEMLAAHLSGLLSIYRLHTLYAFDRGLDPKSPPRKNGRSPVPSASDSSGQSEAKSTGQPTA